MSIKSNFENEYFLKQKKKILQSCMRRFTGKTYLSLQACDPKRIAIEILESLLMIFEIPKRHGTVARISQMGKSCWNFHNVKDGLCKITIAILTLSLNSVLGWLFKRSFGVTQMKLRLNVGSLWRSTIRLARLLFFESMGRFGNYVNIMYLELRRHLTNRLLYPFGQNGKI